MEETVYDTAAWTGRDWDNKLIIRFGLLRSSATLWWVKFPRDYPWGQTVPIWGVSFGYDIRTNGWSFDIAWGQKRWCVFHLPKRTVRKFSNRRNTP